MISKVTSPSFICLTILLADQGSFNHSSFPSFFVALSKRNQLPEFELNRIRASRGLERIKVRLHVAVLCRLTCRRLLVTLGLSQELGLGLAVQFLLALEGLHGAHPKCNRLKEETARVCVRTCMERIICNNRLTWLEPRPDELVY